MPIHVSCFVVLKTATTALWYWACVMYNCFWWIYILIIAVSSSAGKFFTPSPSLGLIFCKVLFMTLSLKHVQNANLCKGHNDNFHNSICLQYHWPQFLITPKNIAAVKNGKNCPKVSQEESNLGNASKTSVFFLDGVFPQKPVLYYTATLLWTTFRSSHNSLSLNGTAHLPS